MMILYIGSGILLLFLVFSLFLTYLVQQIPRQLVHDPPDWGNTIDSKISAADVKDAGDDNPWRKRPAFSAAIRLEAKKQFYTKSF